MRSTLGLHTTNAVRKEEGVVSRLNPGKRMLTIKPGKRSRLVFLTEPEGLAVEQYKMLRHRLCTLHPNGGAVLITSPGPGEGKTLTSVNLAWCLADGGDQVCLVDLDFRAPGVSSAIDSKFEEDGIEDVLNGRRTVAEAIRQIENRSLFVLGIKRGLASPGRFLSPEVLSPVLENLRTMFQWVIVDCAPVIPMADVAEIAPQVDGALMVVRTGKTMKSIILPALETLGSQLWGVVTNDSPIRGSAYYGYYGNGKN